MKTCKHCGHEIEQTEWIKIPELKIEVERDVHDKNKSWNDLVLSNREDELLTAEECIWLANSKYAEQLKMNGISSYDDFFIKPPFELNKKKGYVARFSAYFSWSCLDCYRNPQDSFAYLGVRFVRRRK